MPLENQIEFFHVEHIARKEKVAAKKIFHEAGLAKLPLFVAMPKDLCAYRIDLQRDDLVSRTQLFVTPEYDLFRPVLLRLKPADCAKLAIEKSVEATDFPYAICHADGDIFPAGSDDERGESAQRFTFVQIPPNREIFPTQLDGVQVCWRLFHPNTEDLSDIRHLTVTPEMVVTRSDYLERITALRKTGSRKQAGKSTAGYFDRHERLRRLLVEIAENVATELDSDCSTLRAWIDTIYELRDTKRFDELRLVKPTFTRRWIEDLLRERFEFVQGKPVKKTFTTPK